MWPPIGWPRRPSLTKHTASGHRRAAGCLDELHQFRTAAVRTTITRWALLIRRLERGTFSSSKTQTCVIISSFSMSPAVLCCLQLRSIGRQSCRTSASVWLSMSADNTVTARRKNAQRRPPETKLQGRLGGTDARYGMDDELLSQEIGLLLASVTGVIA